VSDEHGRNQEGPTRAMDVIVIGASAGAVDALSHILPALPAGFPLPIAVVVHLPPDRKSVLAELYASRCQVAVKEAEDKEPLLPGTVYFAPPDYHLLLEQDRRLSLSSDEPVQYSRPSIDVLFESAVDAFDSGVVGVVLTGANNDGAAGLRRIERQGGIVIVQDPEHAYSPVMPKAGAAACLNPMIVPLEKIPESLCRLTRTR